ncbi:hypothetical protein AWB92_02915 [Mycobacterium sp. IEC1808]|uniref:hypothetical protein n=1 Tax=Mycobacterium sp. IEC1808 TaxID=1743230 RepID=UPI000A151EBD|nr:hypothetical protein [Mycobacterium sp. IEC1808]ORW97748.1 hypothetical protein AWB92_02915 [Mycobacterium sp. IEC1808]
MDNNPDDVWIMFITDVESRDKLLSYSRGSQWEVDPNTAAALILVGAAVRSPTPTQPQEGPVNGVNRVNGVVGVPAASVESP